MGKSLYRVWGKLHASVVDNGKPPYHPADRAITDSWDTLSRP